MEIIGIANYQRNAGKTTTAISLSLSLSIFEKKVLLIDTDPNAGAARALGAMISEDQTIPRQGAKKINDRFSVLVDSQITNSAEELRSAIKALAEKFDFLIIDCPPGIISESLNVFSVSNLVIIPVQCDFFAVESVQKLLKDLEGHHSPINKEQIWLLITQFDQKIELSNEIWEKIIQSGPLKVFGSVIPKDLSILDALEPGKTVFDSAVFSKVAYNYLILAKEILKHGRKKTG